MGLYLKGLISGGLTSRIKKKRFETSHGSVARNTFSQAVQYCHPAEGAYIRGCLSPDVFFCFQVDGPITRGAYNLNFTVLERFFKAFW